MKPLLLAAAALLLVPAAAQAQVAAGSLPNSFDRPAEAQAALTPAPAAAGGAPSAVSSTPANAASEETLRVLIAEAQAGTMNYSLMTEGLAAAMKPQEAALTPIIQGFGALVSLDFVASQNGIDVFSAVFANAATEWLIGIDDGKVSALRFRPASEPSAEPDPLRRDPRADAENEALIEALGRSGDRAAPDRQPE